MNNNHQPPLPQQAAGVPDFCLGPWTVHPSLNRISQGDTTESLEPRMMHVLVCLAAVDGRVVARRELLDQVWHDVVVGEEALTRAVSRLRVLLGDPSQDSLIIETIRGVGYRLLSPPLPAGSHVQMKEPDRQGAFVFPIRQTLILAIALIALGLGFWYILLLDKNPDPSPPSEALPFTTYPSFDAYPDFSPDGSTIVFTRGAEDNLETGIFLKQQDVENSRRLTTSPGNDYHPRFSPDGSQVAFVRRQGDSRWLMTVPVMGGATRQLLESRAAVFGMCWSPDGTQLIFAADDPRDGVPRLRTLHLADLSCTAATEPDITTHTGDSWPAISPDGKLLAFARCDHAGLRDLWLKPIAGGPETEITRGLNNIVGISWLPDNQHLVVAAAPEGNQRLYCVNVKDGSFSLLPTLTRGTLYHPTVSPDGQRVVFGVQNRDYNLMRVLPGKNDSLATLAPFSVSTQNELSPSWSPDGKSVAFVSDRSGSAEAWVADADGANLRKLTHTPGVEFGSLHWSPDGSHLAVTATGSLRTWVLVIEVSSGHFHRLNDQQMHEKSCGWSADGLWHNVLRDVGTSWQFFRIDLTGTREVPGTLALNGHPHIVSHGQDVWFEHPESQGLWRAEADGSSWQPVLTPEQMTGVRDWQPTAAGLFLLRREPGGLTEVVLLDLENGQEKVLAQMGEFCLQMKVNPQDGQILVTALARVNADLFQVGLPVELIGRN